MIKSRFYGQSQEAEEEEKVSSTTVNSRSDYFTLKIKNTETGEVVSQGDGSFLAYVQIDG